MSENPERVVPEELLAHAGFVRRLARQLVSEGHAAEDLAQSAFTAALDARSGPRGTVRAWLAGITRNLARMRWRSEAARAKRERSSARTESVPSALQIAARMEVQAKLVHAVANLEEPYRTAIVLRYFDGLSNSAIAQRENARVRTVETRLRRALQTLRARLDHDCRGGRRTWCVALLPIFSEPPAEVSWLSLVFGGALIMSAKLKFVAGLTAVVLLAAIPFVTWNPDPAPEPDTLTADDGIPTVTRADPPGSRTPEPGPDREGPVLLPSDEWVLDVTTQGPDGEDFTDQFTARFLRPGERRPGAHLITERVNRFRLPVSGSGSLVLACASERYPPLRIADLSPAASGERRVTARFGEGRVITGELIHQDGVTPIAGAVVVAPIDRESWLGVPPRRVLAGPNGRFQATGLLPGRYRLLADPADRGDGRRPEPAPEVDAGGAPVRIELLPVTRLIVLVTVEGEEPTQRGSSIITVNDGTGRTLSACSLGLGRSPAGRREFFVPPGQEITVMVDSPGYAVASGGKIRLGPEEREASVTIRLTAATGPKGTLILRPRDSLGRVVGRVFVLRGITAQVETGRELLVENGTVEIEVPAGETRLRLQGPSSSPLLDRELTVNLTAGERKVVDVKFAVGGWIRVIGFRGQWDQLYSGPAGEELTVRPLKRTRGVEGRLLMRGRPVAPGRWILEWRKEDGAIRREVVVTADKTVVVSF